MTEFLDLFDFVPPAKRGRGRPRHEPTREKRKQIRRLLSQRCPKYRIAEILGITEPTLRRYYLPAKKPKEIR